MSTIRYLIFYLSICFFDSLAFLVLISSLPEIQVVTQHLLLGKSVEDVRGPLQALKRRYEKKGYQLPQNWTTDECCIDRPFLRSIFGQNLRVMLDIFHFMKRLGDATYGIKHPAYFEFMQRIRQAIFRCYQQDKEKVR